MFERVLSALDKHSRDTHYRLSMYSQGLEGTKMVERCGLCLQASCVLLGGRMQGVNLAS